MSSIDVAQSKKHKQIIPLIDSFPTLPKTQKKIETRKGFLAELGISSQQFRTLFNSLRQGVAVYKIIYDQEGRPIDCFLLEKNKAYARVNPFKIEHLDNKATRSNTRIKDNQIDWVNVYGKVATTGDPANFETYNKLSDKWFQAYVYSPKKTFVISIFTDITQQKKRAAHKLDEQKKAEQKFLFSEKKYRRLYETTQDGIMARDLKGKMIDCNRAYAEMFGYSKKELRTIAPQKLIPERWHEQRKKIIKKVLLTGHSILFEREYKRKDGLIFPASVRTWRLTDGKGKVVGLWSIVRDITEQKKQQKQLEAHAGFLEKIVEDRNRQLKDAERLSTIGQTAGMVGHDLRNPLQTITGELFLAKNEVDSLPEGEAKNSLHESLQVMEEQAAYMDKIVSDLQAFVQPVRIDKTPVSLKELVTNVISSVSIPGNITIKTLIENEYPQIKVDPNLLKRVLINLVTNSIQAMPDGGNLALVGHVSSKSEVSISVLDTGVGISDAIKDKIFTPLFTTKPRGQGFGLAVCKRVIEAHGGTISFKSKASKGSKFTIKLPVN